MSSMGSVEQLYVESFPEFSLMDDFTFSVQSDLITFPSSEGAKETLERQKKEISNRLQSASFVLQKDKFTFVAGVFNVIFTPYVMAAYPHYFSIWYTIKAILLIATRFLMYYRQNWHYFLFDFCYFANLLLIIYLHFLPNNKYLFILCWSFSNGPLALAIVAWRNSMVFHSLDKITSLFIHLSPPMMTYCLRWKLFGNSHYTMPEEMTVVDTLALPLIFYLLWQVLYWVKVYVFSKHKERMTSAKFLLGDQKGMIYDIVCVPFGKKNADYGFMLLQFIYTFIAILPCSYYYESELLHMVFLIFIGGASIYNGANFYFEVFSKRYIDSLHVKEKEIKHKMVELTESQKLRKEKINSH